MVQHQLVLGRTGVYHNAGSSVTVFKLIKNVDQSPNRGLRERPAADTGLA